MQSPLGELYDSSHFRQLLCPDPFCGVCNGATAKISHLLSQATLQDGAASMSSMDSTVSVTETSLTLSLPLPENTVGYPISDPTYEPSLQSSSIILPHQGVHLEDTLSASPLGDSLLPESIPPVNAKSPLDHDSLHPLASLPLPQHATQETELLPQPTTVLSLVGRPSELFTNVSINKGICSSSHAVSEFIQQQTETDNSSQLEQAHLVNQELLDPHSSESYLWGTTTTYLTLPRNLHFSSLGAMSLLETQDRRADSFKTWEKTSKFDHQNLAVSHPLGSSNNRLHIPQKLSYSKTSEDQLKDKYTQFFWGLPSLHSESMNSIATVLTDNSLTSGSFNRFSDSSMLTHHIPLSLPESQLHNLSQSLSQSQYQPVPQANPQAQLQPPIPVLSPSHSQLMICGVYFHSPKNEAQPLEPSAIQCLEYNILKKEQERVWGLPTVVKNSQKKFCPPPPNLSLISQPSKTHVPRSIFLENCLITSELRKKFEHHLRKRLILQCWGLPKRIHDSLLWMTPQAKLIQKQASSSRSNYGLSWIPFFKQQGKKDLNNTVLNEPESFPEKQVETKLLKANGYSLETVQKQKTGSNTKGTLNNGLQSDCETNLQCHSDSLSCKPSGTSEKSQCQKKLETSLKEHLTTHPNETNEGQSTSTMYRSRRDPFPFTSCVNKKEHKAQKPVKKSAMQHTSFVSDNTSLEESKGKRHSSAVPRMLAEIGSLPLGKRLNSGKTAHHLQGTKTDKKVFVSNKVGKGGQLSGLQQRSTKILKTSQCKSARGADGNTTKAQNTLLAGRA